MIVFNNKRILYSSWTKRDFHHVLEAKLLTILLKHNLGDDFTKGILRQEQKQTSYGSPQFYADGKWFVTFGSPYNIKRTFTQAEIEGPVLEELIQELSVEAKIKLLDL